MAESQKTTAKAAREENTFHNKSNEQAMSKITKEIKEYKKKEAAQREESMRIRLDALKSQAARDKQEIERLRQVEDRANKQEEELEGLRKAADEAKDLRARVATLERELKKAKAANEMADYGGALRQYRNDRAEMDRLNNTIQEKDAELEGAKNGVRVLRAELDAVCAHMHMPAFTFVPPPTNG